MGLWRTVTSQSQEIYEKQEHVKLGMGQLENKGWHRRWYEQDQKQKLKQTVLLEPWLTVWSSRLWQWQSHEYWCIFSILPSWQFSMQSPSQGLVQSTNYHVCVCVFQPQQASKHQATVSTATSGGMPKWVVAVYLQAAAIRRAPSCKTWASVMMNGTNPLLAGT